MTNQTKTFIALGDIASFRFTCTNRGCGTELTVPLQEDYSRTHAADKCPNCHEGWLKPSDVNSATAAPLLEQIVAAIRSISEWPVQCQISLELKASKLEKPDALRN